MDDRIRNLLYMKLVTWEKERLIQYVLDIMPDEEIQNWFFDILTKKDK